MPVILAGNEAQKKKYLGRMTEEPLMCVSISFYLTQANINTTKLTSHATKIKVSLATQSCAVIAMRLISNYGSYF